MYKVNKKLYTLDYVLSKLNYTQIDVFLNSFISTKDEILDSIKMLDDIDDSIEIELLKDQLYYLNQNIDVFLLAMLHHEDLALKYVYIFGDFHQISLN